MKLKSKKTKGQILTELLAAQHAKWDHKTNIMPFDAEPMVFRLAENNYYGERDPDEVILQVGHATEGPSAISTMNFFGSGGTDGSTQFVLDGDVHGECESPTGHGGRGEQVECAGVTDVNRNANHFENAAYSAWKKPVWLWPKHRRAINRLAFLMARNAVKHKTPNRFLKTADFDRAGRVIAGQTFHVFLSRSRISASTHTDPGPFFPYRYWKRRFDFYYAAIKELHPEWA